MSSRAVGFTFALFHMLIICGLLASLILGLRTARVHLPLVDAATGLRNELTRSQLWLDRYLTHTPGATLDHLWAHMAKAEAAILAMHLNAEQTGLSIRPLEDPRLEILMRDLDQGLGTFREHIRQQLATGWTEQNRDELRMEFDDRFRILMDMAQELDRTAHQVIAAQTDRFIRVCETVVILTLGLWLGATLVLRRYAKLTAARLAELQEARSEAEARQQILATTLRSMGDGVMTTDAEGLLTYMNPAAEILTGWSLPEVLGTSTDALLVAFEDVDEGQRLFPVAKVIESRTPYVIPDSIRLKPHGGPLRSAALSVAPILSDVGNLLGVVLVVKDISAQKKAEEKALAASKAKSEFLANMSHELRTPISGIMGMTELALQAEAEPRKRENLTLIKRSAQALLHIINDILDLAKVESGKMALVRERFSLHEVLDAVLRSVAIQAVEKGLSLSSNVDTGCPDLLLGDPYRLEQVLRNLLSNAIKFTKNGDVHVQVDAETPLLDSGQVVLRLAVRDTGIGIPAERMPDLFRSFTQLDASYSKRYAGTGLGLAISKELVQMMGGRIWAESVLDKGSTFAFTLPLDVYTKAEIQTEHGAGPDSLPKLRVLVAEDDLTNRMYIEYLLREADHEPTLVEDGRKAVETLGRGNFDIVLMDVQMPDMGGLEATRCIRQADPATTDTGVPIIALTAFAMRGDRENFLAGGMDGYLTKPLDMDDFIREVGRILADRPITQARPVPPDSSGAAG